ncbi:hypothetical protein C8R43DRAFT_576140 [Mycena crocata]|nr:hypothetical protein C8R43DRAFT_576140 [Mycena crocata]
MRARYVEEVHRNPPEAVEDTRLIFHAYFWACTLVFLFEKSIHATSAFGRATLTMFQIPSVLDSPVLRTSAHGALLCVMTSLIHSSFLSVYFGAWQSPGMAASWMREMRGADPHTFWNFWVFIALPTVWTCWGVFLFIASIILFMWPLKYDAGEEPLGTRVFLLLVLSTGALHLALVVSMLRQVSHHHSVSDGMHAV